jgi:NAD(P)H-hydrate epimerase
MATAGSGDVLSGHLGALLAGGLPPFDAARLGAYLHGRAGDLFAAEWGTDGLTASDLAGWISKAMKEWRESPHEVGA